jgi:5-methyltetrahydrofolate--homocysteine methyltransferase
VVKLLDEISRHVEKGDSARVKELVEKGISLGIRADRILNLGLIEGMNQIGERFKRNEVFIPEVLIASRAMKAAMEIVRLHLPKETDRLREKVLLATVKGDLHDIGKKIVSMMLEGAGFEVIDIGVDVSKETVMRWINKENPKVVGLSALLTTTMTYMTEVVEMVEKSRFRKKVKVIVGGTPVTKLYADEIGADGYAPDGSSAVALVKSLLVKRQKSLRRGIL